MQAIIYTDARNKLNKLINYVNDNSDQVIIVGSKGRKDAVLVSKEEFDNMLENLYVMSNPQWIKSIKKGISQLEKGKGKKLTVEQVLRVQK
ncbi:MAG: type II toxin-antitoxin system Phd/YefM family antitoxin [Ignavibacteriales bacterium]|nr:type II toxin-antitoxin system Phd/YefM family antitoxin [Ignavibacteriales bacterium]